MGLMGCELCVSCTSDRDFRLGVCNSAGVRCLLHNYKGILGCALQVFSLFKSFI